MGDVPETVPRENSDYQPAVYLNETDRQTLIRRYFCLGYTYKEILMSLLCSHGIRLSLRHLKRLLRQMGLKRRLGVYTPIADVIAAIIYEINGSGKGLGYRSMWKRLMHEHDIRVRRDTVLELMWLIDADGVNRRKAKRLLTRKYSCPGPNFLWHLDGYDKLKPFGFAIHGAIDGFSRRILWLQVAVTNNDPLIIAEYYLKCVEKHACVPRILRCDKGTENSTLKLLQPFFRYNCEDRFAGLNSIILGKSTSNQRIEAWWSILRKQNTDWWITYFKDLRDTGVYDDGNPLHCECLKFCFMGIIQTELDNVVKEWNTYTISAKRNAEGPKGKPDVMYFNPEFYHTDSYGTIADLEEIEACKEIYGIGRPESRLPCTAEFVQIVHEIMPDASVPKYEQEALDLFVRLTSILDSFNGGD